MRDRFSFFLLLCVAFFDYIGVGLVIPLFSFLLMHPDYSILPPDTPDIIRGMWMGVLVGLAPLVQFFVSPILGSLSDQRGRRGTLLWALSIGCLGYVLGILGVKFSSLPLLLLFRALFGVCAATMPVVQAAVADMSTPETKGRNFALYNMALGIGFTLGPFLGGALSDPSRVSWFNPMLPFAVALFCTLLNLVLLKWKFGETRALSEKTSLQIFRGFKQAKMAFMHPVLRFSFLGFFFFVFGWDYFSQFISVTLMWMFKYSMGQVANFYAFKGLLYALSAGLFIRHIISKFPTKNILVFSMLAAGPFLLTFSFVENSALFWVLLPPLILLMSLFYPVASTYVSDSASEDEQGELLGVYHSVQALALMLAPFFAGFVGVFPKMPILLGGCSLLLGGLVFTSGRFRSSHRLDETG
ncbi:MAG: MFS transporter [Simkaniaceae bacterium]|nr:MFS transporter [Candidatus Sacchlamyda saccharinae]